VVERLVKEIEAGEAFQVVPSQRFELDTAADPIDVYRMLRVTNPSPYMYLLQIPNEFGETAFSIVGSSPEALVTVQDGRATTHPIAGAAHAAPPAVPYRAPSEHTPPSRGSALGGREEPARVPRPLPLLSRPARPHCSARPIAHASVVDLGSGSDRRVCAAYACTTGSRVLPLRRRVV
jgi:hypothetical protein